MDLTDYYDSKLQPITGINPIDQIEPDKDDDGSSDSLLARIPGSKSYVFMIGFLVVGVGIGIGQHFYYKRFDGFFVDGRCSMDAAPLSQDWVTRFSVLFSFAFKTCLTAAVGIAFDQAFWYTARRKAMSVNALDAMFLVRKNPFKFLNLELLWKAPVPSLMALVSWLLVTSAIFAPSCLTGLQFGFQS
jgi:hypothetical protein